MIKVIILVHSDFEDGRNPEFIFENLVAAVPFIQDCLENDYEVEISKKVEKEK